jgi:hypothetical protein
MKNTLSAWLPFAIGITILCGLVYVSVQQMLRMDANDPQIQIAEDIARALANGQTPQSTLPSAKVDMAKSLASFGMVYSDSDQLVVSSGAIGTGTPSVPSGVLENVRKSGEERLTWQPQKGVRIATVVVRYEGSSAAASGFVLVGRSLRETENRENAMLTYSLAAWLTALLLTFAALYWNAERSR